MNHRDFDLRYPTDPLRSRSSNDAPHGDEQDEAVADYWSMADALYEAQLQAQLDGEQS